MNPLDIIEWNEKGLTLHNQGKYLQAINCYNQAISLDPNNEFIKIRKIQSEELNKTTNSQIDNGNNNNKANL
ncbi:MAG: tetratricopeptide repeat protein [Nitrosopumilus sp.]|nr:tetratricopeptide repeat protein [Nitrosopumilus sp.]